MKKKLGFCVDSIGAIPVPSVRPYTGLDKNDIHGVSAESGSRYFTAWINSLSDSRPIVVMSHVPIHCNRRDNPGGETWYQALSKASEKHDIILLFGHNHSEEEKGRMTDRLYYLVAPGDTMSVQGQDTTFCHTVNFTYANAGYLKLGFASTITFRGTNAGYSQCEIRRYSISGKENEYFGDTHYPNPYSFQLSRK